MQLSSKFLVGAGEGVCTAETCQNRLKMRSSAPKYKKFLGEHAPDPYIPQASRSSVGFAPQEGSLQTPLQE